MNLWDEIDAHLHLFARPVLSFRDPDGFPFSVRTYARQDRARDLFHVQIPEGVPAVAGPAWLLWHTHDDNFDVQHTLAVTGDLVGEDGGWAFRPARVISRMHGDVAQVERAAARYLADRGLSVPDTFPWPALEPIARKVRRDLTGGERTGDGDEGVGEGGDEDWAGSYTEVSRALESTLHHGYWKDLPPNAPITEAADRMTDLLIGRIDARPGERVLDLGCGIGAPGIRLAKASGAAVVGVSITESEIELANAAAAAEDLADRVSFRYGNVMALPFPDDSFDAVCSMEFLYQIPDRPLALREISRVLKPGGRFEGSDFYLRAPVPHEKEPILADLRRIAMVETLTDLDAYLAELRAAGIEPAGTEDISPHVWPTRARYARLLRASRDALAPVMGEKELDEVIAVTEQADDLQEMGFLLISGRKPR
ncbi:methyltransferase domain-containing protein [Streptomyces sennicomposti]|uniref:methyltransferase domain-containing protein n=1 Tax=Streptomyces sennicomposti TaxID=2873384 RepID=UPI001CA75A1D|nr:methyltransferase domain-containing protein [Streptomyces sennicomposti]MBY8867161.1 methyltransferase domain-containing protein [Streptomyces sennicomposti]